MSIHKGDSPKNARIKINYEGKKPTVKFSYPSKKNQTAGSMFVYIFLFWAVLLSGAFVLTQVAVEELEDDFNEELYHQCLLSEDITLRFDCYDIYMESSNDGDISELVPFGILTVLMILFSLLTYLPFKTFWANIYPQWQAFQAKKKIKIFTEKDVEYDSKKGYYCEIPLFENIILNFEATKDFSKYLRELEIEEHKFKYYKTKGKKMRKGKNNTFNEWLWYARFYLTDKPTTGKLEVLFK